MVGNIIPFIGGEEEKSEKEPLRIWGHIDEEKGEIVPATSPVITCQCIRVPVLNGHTAAVFVKFKKNPTKEQLIEKLESYKGVPQELELPSAPKQFIRYMEEDNRPQVTLDVDYENGMGISVGRIREDSVYDWKFVGLSHNTVRGAAGGAGVVHFYRAGQHCRERRRHGRAGARMAGKDLGAGEGRGRKVRCAAAMAGGALPVNGRQLCLPPSGGRWPRRAG